MSERKTREEIRAEWEAEGMSPRQQSPTELRRVFMTWRKDQLVEFLIRAEHEAIEARESMLKAWHETQAVRQYALVLPKEHKRHRHQAADPFNAWLMQNKGQTLDARVVFMEGWKARARADEAGGPHGKNGDQPPEIREALGIRE